MSAPTNPATFSKEVIDVIRPIIQDEVTGRLFTILDPFAGTGGIHALDEPGHIITAGVELEPEWAHQHPQTMVGNALDLPFEDNAFDACVTSPAYGNRMADHHNAQERCKACKATGWVWIAGGKDDRLRAAREGFEIRSMVIDRKTINFGPCEKCGGTGRRTYKRNTYRHHLGRELTEHSSAGLQWGPAYREFHEDAWSEVSRVVRDLFVLNCKDHYRKGEEQPVTAWHVDTLVAIGWTVDGDWIPVKTPGNRFGANRDLRAEHEWVIVLRR